MTTEQITGIYEQNGPRFPDGITSVGILDGRRRIVGANEPGQLVIGMSYRFHGKWVVHQKYGKQFRYDTFVQQAPLTRNGIVVYLTKTCDGIAERLAHRIYDKYGSDSIAMLKDEPDVVADFVTHLPLSVARLASVKLKEEQRFQEAKIELMDLFSGHSFYGSVVDECIKIFGARAAEKVRRDPFCLLTRRLTSCGFARVDALYSKLGLPPDKLKRHVAALWHTVKESQDRSCWMEKEDVIRVTETKASVSLSSEKALRAAIIARWLAKKVINGKVWYATYENARNERRIAHQLKELMWTAT